MGESRVEKQEKGDGKIGRRRKGFSPGDSGHKETSGLITGPQAPSLCPQTGINESAGGL